MRRKKLEQSEPGWEELAADTLPSSYPGSVASVLQGPLIPTLVPNRIRYMCFENDAGSRPVTRTLEREFTKWFYRAIVDGDVPGAARVAALIARDIQSDESLLVAVASGRCERRYTHYTGWKPDHSWDGTSDWGVRLRIAGSDEAGYRKMLGGIAEWVVLADHYAAYTSVLVACPEADVVEGRWWRYADGSRGSPVPVVELGSMQSADELFWTSGASDARAPTLRELNMAGKHFFAVAGGPSGFIRIAEPDQITKSSEFLDRLDGSWIAGQRDVLAREEWGDLDETMRHLGEAVPTLRRFYDRVYRQDFWLVHFAFVDEQTPLPKEVVFSSG
ncbi:MAG: hypothetical protein GY926_22935 [bacterium]|nr:hypothetical protein [bacterium]MCP4968077.1 hypothetical protein [bacterium]